MYIRYSMEEHNKLSGRNAVRLKDRSIDELIGICKGVLFDGSISTGEAKNLFNWLKANPIVSTDWFGKVLYDKLIISLEDGVIDSDEELELLNILTDITGRSDITASGHNAATTLPLCPNPPSSIEINGTSFVLTGNFSYGKRKDVEELIKLAGGSTKKNPSGNTRYLVIGEIGSGAWLHSTFGRKIEEAVIVRDKGNDISIISEEHFFNSINIKTVY